MDPYFTPGYFTPEYFSGGEDPLSEFDQILEDAIPDVQELLGAEWVYLTRQCALTIGNGTTTPRALVLATDAAEGATVVDLALASGAGIKGRLEEGGLLTLAGITYTVQATVMQPDAATSVSGVAILPALAAAGSAGAEVIVTGAIFRLRGLVTDEGRNRQERDLNSPPFLIVCVPHKGAPTTPVKGDGFYRPRDGFRGLVSQIPVALAGAWDLQVGVKVGN